MRRTLCGESFPLRKGERPRVVIVVVYVLNMLAEEYQRARWQETE